MFKKQQFIKQLFISNGINEHGGSTHDGLVQKYLQIII